MVMVGVFRWIQRFFVSSGLVKCVLMLGHGCVAPNVHFYSLNPHLDLNGYPCQVSVPWLS